MVNKLKIQSTIFLIAAMSFLSCTNPAPQPQADKEKKNSTITKPPSSFSDTITIKTASAVFYRPDSIQRIKIKAITDSAVFESMQHDCFYQMRNSRNVLNSRYPNIEIKEVENARYLIFILEDGQQKIIDLNLNNDPCGIYLFRPDKIPRVTDMTNIDTELGFYFSK